MSLPCVRTTIGMVCSLATCQVMILQRFKRTSISKNPSPQVRPVPLCRAGQAATECVCRELQRADAGRMPQWDGVHVAAASACGAGGLARELQPRPATLGAGGPRTRLAQHPAVLTCVKAASRRLRLRPAAGLNPGCARRLGSVRPGWEKRGSTKQRNIDTISVAATANSTSEWREEGIRVTTDTQKPSCRRHHRKTASGKNVDRRYCHKRYGVLSP